MFDKKNNNKELFISKGTQSLGNTTLQIVMDKETGANYIIATDVMAKSVYITPRLDDVGNPLIDDIEEEDDEEDDPDDEDEDDPDDEDDEDEDAEGTLIIVGGDSENQIAVPGKNGPVFFTID